MHKFALFNKSTKFYWSVNRVFYSILFVGFGLLSLKKEVLHFEKNFIDDIIIVVLIAAFIYALFSLFRGLGQVKPLRGELDGYLIFAKDFIQAKDEIFPIEQIRKVKISNDDYNGLWQSSRGNFGPALSNGTNNFVVLFFESGKTRKFQYELYNSNDFQKIREILMEYHLKGKMDFWEVSNVLGEKSTTEVREFKMELEKMSTTANSGYPQ